MGSTQIGNNFKWQVCHLLEAGITYLGSAYLSTSSAFMFLAHKCFIPMVITPLTKRKTSQDIKSVFLKK